MAESVLVQVAYAIGIAEPVSVFVDTEGTSKVKLTDGQIAQQVAAHFDLRPAAIVKRFGLRNPIFEPTASYGHFGQRPYTKDGIEFFGWEKLDEVENLRKIFSL